MLLAFGVVSARAADAGLERWEQLRAEMAAIY
jgi:hypothetical protein